MDHLLTQAFLSAMLFGSVTAAVPLLFAGIGEQISEKAGVLNIGLEGMVLVGCYGGFLVAYLSGSLWLGFLGGALAGGVAGLVMAALCVWLAMNQVIIGIALTLVVQGLTALLFHYQYSRTYPRLPEADRWPIPLLGNIPVLGPGVFDHHPLVYIAFLTPVATAFIYRHTFFGLNLTSASDSPAALDATGVSVARTRTIAVILAGLFAGLGGSYMAEVGSGLFVPFMSNGAGYMAIVLAMLSRGRPLWVFVGAIVFGMCLSAATALQVGGVEVPTDIINMLPFASVMAMLVLFGRRAKPPNALGVPYVRGQRG